MKIEKISSTQMKFVLRHDELEERDIDISEMSHTSDKTQQLFKEIVKLAQEEGSFLSESTPYLIEAMRVGVDSLVIMVTQLDEEDLKNKYSLVPAAKERCKFKRAGFISQPEHAGADSHSVFSFGDIDTVASACEAIAPVFCGHSRLYKLEGRFFLWLANETEDDRPTSDLEAILREFGDKHVSSALSLQYLQEHGDEIIADDAIDKLSMYSAVAKG